MKRGVIFAIIGALVLIGGVGAGIYLVQQQQIFQEKAAPASSLTITPNSISKGQGQNFTFQVNMSTGLNAVTAINIVINFNPKEMQIVSVTKGSGVANLDTKLTDSFDNTNGSITFAYFTPQVANAVTGSNLLVMTVNATVKSDATTGNSNIAFDAATSASATSEGTNVIVSKSGAVLTVTAGSGSTATPTPTGTPNGSATPTPTPTEEATGSPTAAPSATPVPIPVTGVDWPTILGAGIGGAVIIGSILLAI